MREVAKGRFLCLLGSVSLLFFGLSIWVALGFAFGPPAPGTSSRFGDSVLTLIVAGVCAFVSSALFIKSGYSEHVRPIDTTPVRIYLIGLLVFGLVFLFASHTAH